MTPEEYQEAKQTTVQYETLVAERDKLKRIKDTADTLSIASIDGEVMELTGAEPLAALGEYVTTKLQDIDKAIDNIGKR